MSRYFTIDEMRCHSGEAYPAEWSDRLAALFGVMDVIRDAWDGPLYVVCGYRTAAYNQALAEASAKRNGGKSGVAQNSQHVQGRAADIRPASPTVERVAELHELTRRLYEEGKIPALGGIGLYPGWIHVDVRAKVNGHLATWGGTGSGESS